MPQLTASSRCSQPKKPAPERPAPAQTLWQPQVHFKGTSMSYLERHMRAQAFVWTAGHQTPSKTPPARKLN